MTAELDVIYRNLINDKFSNSGCCRSCALRKRKAVRPYYNIESKNAFVGSAPYYKADGNDDWSIKDDIVKDEGRWLSQPGRLLQKHLEVEKNFIGLELCYCKVEGDGEWWRLIKEGYFGSGFCPYASRAFEVIDPEVVILLGKTVTNTLNLPWKELRERREFETREILGKKRRIFVLNHPAGARWHLAMFKQDTDKILKHLAMPRVLSSS